MVQPRIRRVQDGYVRFSRHLIKKSVISFAALACFAVAAYLLGRELPRLPAGGGPGLHLRGPAASQRLVPPEDERRRPQGGGDHEEHPGVKTYTSVIGFSLLSTVYNTYSGFLLRELQAVSERTKPEESYAPLRRT